MGRLNNILYRTILFMLSITFIFSTYAYSQISVVDSLEKVLGSHTKIDTAKVNLLNNLAYKLYIIDQNKARQYANQSLSIARELNYPKGEAASLWAIGLSNLTSDKIISLDYFNKALAIAERHNHIEGICNYLMAIGNVVASMGDTEKSDLYFNRALKLASNLEDKTLHQKLLYNVSNDLSRRGQHAEAIAKIHELIDIAEQTSDNKMLSVGYSSIANTYRRQGNNPLALEYFLSALRISEQLNDKKNLVNSLINIAGIKSEQNQYQESLETIDTAFIIAKELNDSILMSVCLTNKGNVYKDMKHPDALDYLKQAHQMLRKKVLGQNINIIMNIGAIHTSNGEFAEAEANLTEALEMAESAGIKNGQCEALIYLANLRYAQKRYKDAIEYANKAISLSNRINYLEIQMDSHKLLADIYTYLGNYQVALSNYKNFKKFQDSIFNEKNVRRIAMLESAYKYEKDKQKYEKEKFNNLTKIRKQRYYIFSLSAVVVLIFLLAYQLYISNKFKKRSLMLEIDLANSELEYSRKKLTSATLRLVQNSERDDYCIKMLKSINTDLREEREQQIRALINYYKNQSVYSNWDEIELLFLKVNTDFYDKLNTRFPSLTLNERKLCVFLKLNMNNKDISKITFQSEEALKKARLRLRKKINLDRNENLSSFIQSI